MRIYRILLLACCMFLLTAQAVLAFPRIPSDAAVSVVGFGYMGEDGSNRETREKLADLATQSAAFYLSRSTGLNITEVADREKILQEQGLELAGNIEDSTAREIGKLQKADYVLCGNIVGMGIEFTDEDNPLYDRETKKAMAKISVHLIDVRTGSVISMVTSDGSSECNSGSVLRILGALAPTGNFDGYVFYNQAASAELLNNAVEDGLTGAMDKLLDKLTIKHKPLEK
ncbi:CsgG/HfaB family protein [Selenomonas ruminantium]|uniref:Curli production assembly/transport component CsgG n=1 Tax=Selenomonas ruminantium TaxID=971 RepID=A0A1K1Q468_SELRU|nr:CsgG/HfaB family protein [Selenomonas ruminantium]SFW54810.1 Curli production assembly/transport component CsgG [Selenomonas ruminantium]